MPPESVAVSAVPPLTHLNEDEQLFRSTVREFSQQTIGPLVRQMDEEQHFSADLLPQLFQLGLDGHRDSRRVRRRRRIVFRSHPCRRGDFRGRSLGRRIWSMCRTRSA